MTKLEDWNELTHHLLEVVYVSLQNTRGPASVRHPSASLYVVIICSDAEVGCYDVTGEDSGRDT